MGGTHTCWPHRFTHMLAPRDAHTSWPQNIHTHPGPTHSSISWPQGFTHMLDTDIETHAGSDPCSWVIFWAGIWYPSCGLPCCGSLLVHLYCAHLWFTLFSPAKEEVGLTLIKQIVRGGKKRRARRMTTWNYLGTHRKNHRLLGKPFYHRLRFLKQQTLW